MVVAAWGAATILRMEAAVQPVLLVVVVILLLVALGSFPGWPHSASWGYYPSGGIGLLVLILLVLLLLGRI